MVVVAVVGNDLNASQIQTVRQQDILLTYEIMLPDLLAVRHLAHEFIQAEILSVVDWPELDLSIAAWVNRNHQSAYIDVWPALTFATTGGDLQAAVPLVALWLLHIMAARVLTTFRTMRG